MFSVALSVEEFPTLAQRPRKNGPPPSRTLSGTLLCGVRTFLSPRPKALEATVRSGCQLDHYNLPLPALGSRLREQHVDFMAPGCRLWLLDLIPRRESVLEAERGKPNSCTPLKPFELRCSRCG